VTAGFVGRATELHVLADALSAAQAGDARVAVVTGEAGIGKTRLCREIAGRAGAIGFAVAWGSCWPDGGAPPLWPWGTVLDGLRDPAAAASPSPTPPDPGGTEIDAERFSRFAAIADQVAHACDRSPVLVIIDDAHAADAGALLLARFVARALARRPFMLLLTSRPTGDGGPSWVDSDALVLGLGPFSLDETGEFLRDRRLDDGELRTLYWLTGGHPLYLSHLLARGGDGETSDNVRAAITRALSGLSPATTHVLRYAAVLGPAPAEADLPAVAGIPPAAVRDALEEAAAGGLIALTEPGGFTFGHEIVREVLHDQLSVADRTAAHARAAAALAPRGQARADLLARYAHHAVHAAPRSPSDAGRAVAACHDAARALVGGFAYEQAATLLATATTLHGNARLASPLAPLLVDHAEAVLQCGRLGDARGLFDEAATAAARERDPVALARAAVGLGGVWVNEHRGRLDWERVVGLQRRALDGLPEGETGLRLRLRVRLAVEDVYRGGPVGPALDALAEARGHGDGRVLAEALSLCHHALLTAEHTYARVELADEQIRVASAAGEGMLALVGLCWRTVAAFHVADPRAVQLLAELRERAEFLSCLSVLYIVDAMETMLTIRAGRLDEAEARAYRCFELGTEVGDADALGYLGAHLTTIRWLQARDEEMLATVERIAESPTLNPAEFAFAATVAGLAARAGEHARAHTILDRVTADGLAALPQSSTWLAGMQSIVEAARILARADLARQAYELLLPYAELTVAPSLAVTCFGSVERVLGLAALAYGDLDRAVDHLDRAVVANRRLGNRPVTAVTGAELAEALLARQGPGDRAAAIAHLTTARVEADAMGLELRAREWADRLAGYAEEVATIVHRGRQWTLTIGRWHAVVADRLGVGYLAQLLTNPGRPISAHQLAGGAPEVGGPAPQPILDERARAAYRARVTALTDEIGYAEGAGDGDTAERLRAELDALLAELRRNTGRRQRSRSFADPAERARTAVRKAIKRAIDDIASAEPAIGTLLRETVTTGATCCYTPDAARPVRWSADTGLRARGGP